MSVAAAVRQEIDAARVGDWFTVQDVAERHGRRHAVELALTRAAHRGDLVPVKRGLYWKGRKTRFGTTAPDVLDAALAAARAAGFSTGVGPAGWTASHVLGLSTQIPALVHVAVPGRPPEPPQGAKFHQRATAGRAGLGVLDVALLEVLRTFPHMVQSDWADVVRRVERLARESRVDVPAVLAAAQRERHPAMRARAQELGRALGAATTEPAGRA